VHSRLKQPLPTARRTVDAVLRTINNVHYPGAVLRAWNFRRRDKGAHEAERRRVRKVVQEVGEVRGIEAPEVCVNPKHPDVMVLALRSRAMVVVGLVTLSSLSDIELRAVIEHEISHIQHNDHASLTLITIATLWALLTALPTGLPAAGLAFAGTTAVRRTVGRRQELRCDEEAARQLGDVEPFHWLPKQDISE